MEGKSHSHLTPDASQRFGVQIIYQDLSLFPNLTVAENIAFRHHVETAGAAGQQEGDARASPGVMDRLKVSLPLDELVGSSRLPRGNWWRLPGAGGAGAPGGDGRADGFLESPGGGGLLEVVHELKRQKIASVFVSHRLDEVMDIAERVTVMRDGRNFGTYG